MSVAGLAILHCPLLVFFFFCFLLLSPSFSSVSCAKVIERKKGKEREGVGDAEGV